MKQTTVWCNRCGVDVTTKTPYYTVAIREYSGEIKNGISEWCGSMKGIHLCEKCYGDLAKFFLEQR